MEFKKREVKKPEPQKREEYSFKNKMLVVSVVCEVFEISNINDAESKCPVPAIGRNYNTETRIRNIPYDISEGPQIVKKITSYWNEWINVGIGIGKKVKFSIKENKNIETEEEAVVPTK
ncbi:MAG: hypothetical protein H8D80_01540 [Proteobacteria bacterium]|nr:hypothetical protein [Pseudomonadota bacterium]